MSGNIYTRYIDKHVVTWLTGCVTWRVTWRVTWLDCVFQALAAVNGRHNLNLESGPSASFFRGFFERHPHIVECKDRLTASAAAVHAKAPRR